jgi:hypothetical protein
MLISIVKAKGLMKAIPFVSERPRRRIGYYLVLHRGLMVFFFFGYLTVMTALAYQYSFLSETFVSVIFLFGAVFVFTGIAVQSRLLSELQITLKGIVPICSKCKKIRTMDADSSDPNAWKGIEEYISERSDVAFSHGYCPKCYKEEINEITRIMGKTRR